MDIFKPSFKLLEQYYKAPERNLKRLLANFLDKDTGEAHQGITRTVYGVVRRELTLDFILQQLSRRKPGKIQTDVLILLRIAIYFLIFSGSYPDYAVVNEAVQLTKDKAKGFVNAVLRRCTRDKNNIKSILETIREPHIKYSISPLLIDHLKTISIDVPTVLEYLDREPVFHIRTNQKNFDNEEVKEVLAREQLIFKELKSFNSFEVEGAGGSGTRLRRLLKEKKYFYFQNTASQLISIIAAQFSKEAVLDCCAAPGTKSVTLSLLKPQLTIYANDINVKRIFLLKDFCHDYQLKKIIPLVSDVNTPCFKKNFNFIVLDAPCTSSGTLRKNPDLKLKINQNMVRKHAENQYRMLCSVIDMVSNGYILYSVCSFMKDETEDVLERIVNRKDWEIIDLSGILEDYGFEYKKAKYGFYLLPDAALNNDLFYISLLRIKNGKRS